MQRGSYGDVQLAAPGRVLQSILNPYVVPVSEEHSQSGRTQIQSQDAVLNFVACRYADADCIILNPQEGTINRYVALKKGTVVLNDPAVTASVRGLVMDVTQAGMDAPGPLMPPLAPGPNNVSSVGYPEGVKLTFVRSMLIPVDGTTMADYSLSPPLKSFYTRSKLLSGAVSVEASMLSATGTNLQGTGYAATVSTLKGEEDLIDAGHLASRVVCPPKDFVCTKMADGFVMIVGPNLPKELSLTDPSSKFLGNEMEGSEIYPIGEAEFYSNTVAGTNGCLFISPFVKVTGCEDGGGNFPFGFDPLCGTPYTSGTFGPVSVNPLTVPAIVPPSGYVTSSNNASSWLKNQRLMGSVKIPAPVPNQSLKLQFETVTFCTNRYCGWGNNANEGQASPAVTADLFGDPPRYNGQPGLNAPLAVPLTVVITFVRATATGLEFCYKTYVHASCSLNYWQVWYTGSVPTVPAGSPTPDPLTLKTVTFAGGIGGSTGTGFGSPGAWAQTLITTGVPASTNLLTNFPGSGAGPMLHTVLQTQTPLGSYAYDGMTAASTLGDVLQEMASIPTYPQATANFDSSSASWENVWEQAVPDRWEIDVETKEGWRFLSAQVSGLGNSSISSQEDVKDFNGSAGGSQYMQQEAVYDPVNPGYENSGKNFTLLKFKARNMTTEDDSIAGPVQFALIKDTGDLTITSIARFQSEVIPDTKTSTLTKTPAPPMASAAAWGMVRQSFYNPFSALSCVYTRQQYMAVMLMCQQWSLPREAYLDYLLGSQNLEEGYNNPVSIFLGTKNVDGFRREVEGTPVGAGFFEDLWRSIQGAASTVGSAAMTTGRAVKDVYDGVKFLKDAYDGFGGAAVFAGGERPKSERKRARIASEEIYGRFQKGALNPSNTFLGGK